MSRHHAPDELLLDYAAGVLPEGPALAVALHVALDPAVAAAGATVATAWAARCSTRSPARPTWARRRSRRRWRGSTICRSTTRGRRRRPRGRASNGRRRRCGRTSRASTWRRAFGGFEEIRLDLHGDAHRVSLLRLEPGEGLPLHRHVANEYTVVLQGGYTDNTGNYGVGDFAVGPGPQEHGRSPIRAIPASP